MKKSILTLLGVGLLLTSCQSDEPFAPVEGGEKQVTFTLNVPGELGTRAGATDNASDKGGWTNSQGNLSYTLVLKAANDVQTLTADAEDNQVTFTPTVVLGREYTVTAYAYFGDTAKSTINAIAESKGINDETKDAYTWTGKINFATDQDGTNQNITLKRPYAKLRLIATDYNEAKTDVKSVTVEYKNQMYTMFNAVEGQFNSERAVSFTNTWNKDYYEATTTDGSKTIFADYVPVNETGVAPFTVTVEYQNGETYTRKFVEDIPVKRNALTTLKGAFFTAGAEIKVEVKDAFEGQPENINFVSVSNASQLQDAINNAPQGETTEIILDGDIDLTGSLVFGASPSNNPAPTRSGAVAASRNLVINGNGKTLTYKGAAGGRIIDFKAETNGASLTLKNLTIINNVSWIERAVNYNTNGTLTLENVTIKSAEGCSLNYAINLPASSANAKVEIKNCEIWAGAQALNLWGERTMVNVTNSALYVVDNSAEEGRSVVAINNNGETIADYCVLDFNGGSIQVVYVGEGETKPSYAIRNNTAHSTINVSPDTNVVGEISNPVAIIYWEGQNQYYSLSDLNAALDAAVPEYKATGVRMINNLTLPLAKKAIYGTPVAVQMKNGGVFDGCNNTLSVENPEYNAYVVETYGGTIKNLNITTPAGRGIIISSPKEDIYLHNVYVNGPGYALNTTEHNGKNLVVENSTFNGWTSFAGLVSASFTSCTFGVNTYEYWQKSGYDKDYDRLIRPYVETSFNSCVFEEGFYIDLSALAADKKVTLKDCVCGKVKITVENYSQYITIELPSGRILADCVVFE